LLPRLEAQYPDVPTVLTIDEAAQILDCHPDSVRKLVRQGRIPTVRLGRLYRIPRHRLIEYLAGGDAG
jgi:excisionase family DNA binding protein